MTLRQYLVVMAGGTTLCGATTALIILAVDPERTHAAVFVAFYASLFLTLAGIAALAGLGLRLWLRRSTCVLACQVEAAFRQALLLSAAIIIALLLVRQGLLGWLNGLLLLSATLLIDRFLASLRARPH
ncbi:MAG: hypothetical protein PHT12_01220 [Patescibacteria group bacterium]|nr:hypothetical protein [Patescibacteria group bacterium]